LVWGTDPEVDRAVRSAIEVLAGLGAEYKETSMPSVAYGIPTTTIIAPAECSSNLARYDGVRYGLRSKNSADVISMYENTREEGFGAEVKQRINDRAPTRSRRAITTRIISRRRRFRTLLRRDFEKAFEEFDVLIAPTSPTVAFKIGELADDPYAMKLADVCTIPSEYGGHAGDIDPVRVQRAAANRLADHGEESG